MGITVDGDRDVLGLWVGPTGGEGAKQWMGMLTELRNRGVTGACIVVCDGLSGLPDAIAATWPAALVQTCVLHLVRNTFRYASRADWEALAKDLRPIYTAPTESAARARLADLTEKWGRKYPAIPRLWERSWDEFVPFLDYDAEIRRVVPPARTPSKV